MSVLIDYSQISEVEARRLVVQAFIDAMIEIDTYGEPASAGTVLELPTLKLAKLIGLSPEKVIEITKEIRNCCGIVRLLPSMRDNGI